MYNKMLQKILLPLILLMIFTQLANFSQVSQNIKEQKVHITDAATQQQ